MSTRTNRNGAKPAPAPQELDALYLKLVKLLYEAGDRKEARQVAARLEKSLASAPDIAGSIRGEEIRSLVAESRGDYAEAARSREAEIRKILQLHALTANTAHWEHVSQQYDFADVSDRLDLLATLYDSQGDRGRAVAVLLESKQYCQSHQIPFDAQDMLDELGQPSVAAASRRKTRSVPKAPRRRSAARGRPGRKASQKPAT